MSLLDCLLITFANVAICITLPKLLSLIVATKTSKAEQLKPTLTGKQLTVFG
jgi:hypothetical protein